MVIGIVWAVAGYALCSVTNRGQLVTTIVTAMAGALGLGAHAIGHYHGQVGHLGTGVIVLEIAVIAAGIVAAVVMIKPWTGRHKHGSAAIASTRYVLYKAPEDIAREDRLRKRDRLRNARK